jgi:hypothetical protein
MKATHYGTCQVCESTQKSDARTNRLAAHGYTLAYGWQAGTCEGSGQLPLEVSKGYAEACVESCKAAVAAFVATPCPERTEGISRWDKCPKIAAWKQDQAAHAGRKQYITWTTARLANWAPREQKTVEAVEAVERSAKAARTGIRALSGAVALAKRDLVKFGERFEDVVDEAVNGELYADRRAFWDACAAKGDRTSVWSRHAEIVNVPSFATNRVAKLASLARSTGNTEVIEGAVKLEALSAAYEAAKAAYEAAK